VSKLDPQDEDYAKGLLAERAGAIQNKNKDHQAQIEKELKRVGWSGSLEANVDPRQEVAAVAAVQETATVKRRTKSRKLAKPRDATPAEEKAIAATVEAEAKAEEEAEQEAPRGLTSDWLTGKPDEQT
jgi:hypothetical protein